MFFNQLFNIIAKYYRKQPVQRQRSGVFQQQRVRPQQRVQRVRLEPRHDIF